MTHNIYTVEDFEERLSELAIGTEDAQQLMDFVRWLDTHYRKQSKRVDVAATILGHGMIENALMDEH
jgi:hypothetical protein